MKTFNNLFRACAAQPACAKKYGDLASIFTGQVQQLEANPLITTATYPPPRPASESGARWWRVG